jgi:hypothetical protein
MLERGDTQVGRLSRGDGACCLAGADGGEFLIEESVLGGSLGRVAARVVGWDRGHSRNLPSGQVPSPSLYLTAGSIYVRGPTSHLEAMSTAASSAIFHHEIVVHRCGWQLRFNLADRARNQ